jgi:hypothetical protein
MTQVLTKLRPIKQIALDILNVWKNPNYGAVPYLHAMKSLSTIDDMYYADSAQSIILYFLSNASTFRGEDARNLKAELKRHLK